MKNLTVLFYIFLFVINNANANNFEKLPQPILSQIIHSINHSDFDNLSITSKFFLKLFSKKIIKKLKIPQEPKLGRDPFYHTSVYDNPRCQFIGFSEDETKIVIVLSNNNAIIYDLEKDTILQQFENSQVHMMIAEISPENDLLTTWGGDKFDLWDIRTGQHTLQANGKYLNLNNEKKLYSYKSLHRFEKALLSPDSIYEVSSEGHDIKFRNLKKNTFKKIKLTDLLESAIFLKNGTELFVRFRSDTPKIYSLETGEMVHDFTYYSDKSLHEFDSFSYFPESNLLFFSSHTEKLSRVWDMESKELLGTIEGVDLVFSNHYIATTMNAFTDDQYIKIFDRATFRFIANLEGRNPVFSSIDSSIVTFSLKDKQIKVWKFREFLNFSKLE